MSINLQVTIATIKSQYTFTMGRFIKGFKKWRFNHLKTGCRYLKANFLNRDMNRAMEAFMSGKIRVKRYGTINVYQTASPSAEQKTAFQRHLSQYTSVIGLIK